MYAIFKHLFKNFNYKETFVFEFYSETINNFVNKFS